MAYLYVTEYRRQAKDGISVPMPAGMEPALANQRLAIGAISVASAAFNANTSFVAVNADVACCVTFAAAPTATTSLTRIPADGTQYFGVNPGDKLAVIAL